MKKLKIIYALLYSLSILAFGCEDDIANKGLLDSQSFVKQATVRNLYEIDAGQLASTKGVSQTIRDFGALMVQDHTASGEALANTANSRKYLFADTLDLARKILLDTLNVVEGAAFDKLFIDQMVQSHEETVQLFEAAGTRANDDAIKEFAQSMLPKLKEHRDRAIELQNSTTFP
jgi:putative membrane protein